MASIRITSPLPLVPGGGNFTAEGDFSPQGATISGWVIVQDPVHGNSLVAGQNPTKSAKTWTLDFHNVPVGVPGILVVQAVSGPDRASDSMPIVCSV